MKNLLLAIAISATTSALAQEHASSDLGLWTPIAGQCSAELHDSYQIDGKAAWHPEVDPSGCSFGHTHPFVDAEARYNAALEMYFNAMAAAATELRGDADALIARSSMLADLLLEERRIFIAARSATIAFHVVPHEPTKPQWSAWMGQWKPTQPNECAQELHDAYALEGPDGLLYPTWHPAVDPSGCFYGHSHGDDPATSKIKNRRLVLFGYVNAQGMKAGIHMVHRNEDHAGNKIAVGNDVPFGYTGIAANITCNVLSKFHQGTHSPDALTNNLHEQTEQLECSNGWRMNVQLLTQVQKAGWFTPRGTTTPVYVGVPVPADSPVVSNAASPGGSMGTRFLPTKLTIERNSPDYGESWQTINTISAPGGRYNFVRFSNYWNVGNPARYYDPDQPNKIARVIDACYLPGTDKPYLINSGMCVTQRRSERVAWDSPDSLFNGSIVSLRPDSWAFKMVAIDGAPETCWYTDVLARTVLAEGEEGVVKQCASAVNHPQTQYGFRGTGGGLPATKNQPGVHAPN